MVFWILAGLTFVVFLIGTVTDIKSRELPDYVSGMYIIAALTIRGVWAVIKADAMIFLAGVVLGGAVFFFSYLMYKARMWGGGDVKLLTGVVIALAGFNDRYVFVLFYMLNFFVVGAIYGIAMSFIYALKNPEGVKKDILAPKNGLAVLTGMIGALAIYFGVKIEIAKITAVLLPAVIVLEIVLRAVEKNCFVKKIPVSRLTEGDWVVTELKGVYNPEKDVCVTEKIINEFRKGGYKEVVVKEGIPYIPSFLISFIITVLNKDLFFAFIVKSMGLAYPPIL